MTDIRRRTPGWKIVNLLFQRRDSAASANSAGPLARETEGLTYDPGLKLSVSSVCTDTARPFMV
jgi:hypothetical protein